MKLGILYEEELAKALGAQLNIPHATLENNLLQPDVNQGLDKIVPYDFAKANFVLPLKKNAGNLTCAVADPLDLLMLDNLKMVTGHEVNLMIATRAELMNAIQEFYAYVRSMTMHTSSGASNTSQQIPKQTVTPQLKEAVKKEPGLEKLIEKAEEAPVIKLVDLIIRQAIEQRASDIHIEPFKDKVNLRYRIDGALYQIPPPAKHLHLPIVSRLKILSKLDIAEKRLPQDGAITFQIENRPVDIRISTIPTVWGEKVVMRILDKAAVPLQLAQLQ